MFKSMPLLYNGKYIRKTNVVCQQFRCIRNLRKTGDNMNIPSQEINDKDVRLKNSRKNPKFFEENKANEKPLNLTTGEQYSYLNKLMAPFSMISYENQLQMKTKDSKSFLNGLRKRLKKNQKKILSINVENSICPSDDIKPSANLIGYRSSNEFSISEGLDGNPKTVGFFIKDQNNSQITCVPPTYLITIKDSHKLIAKKFEEYIQNTNHDAWSFKTEKGVWKNIIVRSTTEDDNMVIISINPIELKHQQIIEIKEQIREYFFCGDGSDCPISSLYLHKSYSSSNNFYPDSYELITGEPFIVQKYNDFSFKITPEVSFNQNIESTFAIYEVIKQLAQVNDLSTVLEVECSTGHISTLFSSDARNVIGIDKSKVSIKNAIENQTINNGNNSKYYAGNTSKILPELLDELEGSCDIVAIVNGYQQGISNEAIKSLLKCASINRVIYLSKQPNQNHTSNILHFFQASKMDDYDKDLKNIIRFYPSYAIPIDTLPHTKYYTLALRFDRNL